MVLTAASQLCPATPSPQNSLEKDDRNSSVTYKETWDPKPLVQDLACPRLLDKARVPQRKQNCTGMRVFNKTRPLGLQGIPTQAIPPMNPRCVGPSKGQETFGNYLLQGNSSKLKDQRHPRPPPFPRSHSSKDLQQTSPRSSSSLKAGRRILSRSYSTPNISSSNGIKLPKPTQDFMFKGSKTKECNMAKTNEEKQRHATSKELPAVGPAKTRAQPWKIPFSPSKMVKQLHQTVTGSSKSSEPSQHSENIMKEISHLNGSERNEEDEWDWKELTPTSKHVVFVINHDDGRLETLGTLQPVPEEPEHEQYACTGKAPWHCHDNEPRHHEEEDLLESDDEGLIMRNDKSLDPIKKAMINNWIMDVTLKTSQTEDQESSI